MNAEILIEMLELCGTVAIVSAIWLAFGAAAGLGAFGVALLVYAAVLTHRR